MLKVKFNNGQTLEMEFGGTVDLTPLFKAVYGAMWIRFLEFEAWMTRIVDLYALRLESPTLMSVANWLQDLNEVEELWVNGANLLARKEEVGK